MVRIPALATLEAAPAAVRKLLDAVQLRWGRVPNLYRTLARSPAALQGYVGLDRALRRGVLPATTRVRIALAVAERAGADYCLSAHIHFARNAGGLDDAEITANRNGASNDPTVDAAIRFATALARTGGAVSDAEFAAFKAAGYGDDAAIEITALVALHTLATTLNKLARLEVDFPVVSARAAA